MYTSKNNCQTLFPSSQVMQPECWIRKKNNRIFATLLLNVLAKRFTTDFFSWPRSGEQVLSIEYHPQPKSVSFERASSIMWKFVLVIEPVATLKKILAVIKGSIWDTRSEKNYASLCWCTVSNPYKRVFILCTKESRPLCKKKMSCLLNQWKYEIKDCITHSVNIHGFDVSTVRARTWENWNGLFLSFVNLWLTVSANNFSR